ncbi:putative 7-deoxyloganetin glucosyltransferase [Dioscorea sansibarensis]
MKNIHLRHLPSFIRTTDANDIPLNFMIHVFQKVFQTSAIIINTFDELEGNVLEAMAEMLPPIYTVGPLSLFSDHGSSFWKEDMNCLAWLDGKLPKSVIYVNFGSIAELTKEQLLEFAWGLVGSGHDFLWIIRQGLVKGNQENDVVLPEEILREMNGKGLITSWCQQEKVLSHPSIAGFLTHSGWNSTLESISVGLPMLCCPYYADQLTNCHYVCKEWGIGMEIEHDVKREKVASLIKELMSGEKGKEMKEKALEWKECASRAIREGGSSSLNLEKLVKEVLRRRDAI